MSLNDRLFELERGERVEQLPGTDLPDELLQRNGLRAGGREASPDLGEAVPRTELDDGPSPAPLELKAGFEVASRRLQDGFTGQSITSSSKQAEVQEQPPSIQLIPTVEQAQRATRNALSQPTQESHPQDPILLLPLPSPTMTVTLTQASRTQGAASLQTQDQLFQTRESEVEAENPGFGEHEHEEWMIKGTGTLTKDGGEEEENAHKKKRMKKDKKRGNAIDDLFRDVL